MSVLVISHLALWLVVIAMAAIVVSLMRQTGVLLERISPAGLSADDSLALKKGQAVEKMALTTLNGDAHTVGGAQTAGAQLLLFVSPRCDVCKSILPSAAALADALQGKLEITLAVADAAEGALPQAANAIAQVPAEKIASQFGVSQLPHLVLIREDGLLEASQYVPSLADFKARTAPLQPAKTTQKQMKHNKPVGDLV
jgi:methylamine dehydrogenase accessory protein MauD